MRRIYYKRSVYNEFIYDKDMTQELHRVAFFVAETAQEAKHKALKEIEMFKEEGHIDQVVDVEACLLHREGEKYYIALDESEVDFEIGLATEG